MSRFGEGPPMASTPDLPPGRFATRANLAQLTPLGGSSEDDHLIEWDSWRDTGDDDDDDEAPSSADILSKSFTFGARRASVSLRPQLGAIRSPVQDLNATFPAPAPSKMRVREGRGLHKLRGNGMDTLSFTPTGLRHGGSHGAGLDRSHMSHSQMSSSMSLNHSNWGLRSLVGSRAGRLHGGGGGGGAPGPRKAVVTIDESHAVLTANHRACELFGYGADELAGVALKTLLPTPSYVPGKVVPDALLGADGTVQRVNGRVVEARRRDGAEFAVSLWMAPAGEQDGRLRFMAVMEPVARTTAVFGVGADGAVVWCEEALLRVCALAAGEVEGRPLSALVPSMRLTEPGTPGAPIHVTVRSHGGAVPATLLMEPVTPELRDELAAKGLDEARLGATVDFGVLHVYRNISGLVTVDDAGVIVGCNETFVLLLFGYSERELLGRPVTTILPEFCVGTGGDGGGGGSSGGGDEAGPADGAADSADADDSSEPAGAGASDADADASRGSAGGDCEVATRGLHADGEEIELTYEVKRVVDAEFKVHHCIWISKEAGDGDGAVDASAAASEEDADADTAVRASLAEGGDASAEDEALAGAGVAPADLEAGEFGERYGVCETLGVGSFGSVFVAASRETGDNVVVKFIEADKVLAECLDPAPDSDAPWVERCAACAGGREIDGRPAVAREVLLLMELSHPNISKALDVFVSPTHYQLVLEHRGPTKDLFQYIDEQSERGVFDEAAAGYIVRQVARAVDYLHTLPTPIVHRDIKDENVVVDALLRAQLVDFGSAAYVVPGRLFDTFCGTLEYCAPEVLCGNPYRGPELDMFALGVTMYALVFGERPFTDVEETIDGTLRPPFAVGAECEDLLLWVLHADPAQRATASDVVEHPWCLQVPAAAMAAADGDGGEGGGGGGAAGDGRLNVTTPPEALSRAEDMPAAPRSHARATSVPGV